MNWVMGSLVGLVLLSGSAWADVACKAASVQDQDDKRAVVTAKLCSITYQSPGVYGVDPLQSLQTASSAAKTEAREACEKEKMVRAAFVSNFATNSFEVSSVGVVNGSYGATATLTGRFLCVQDTRQHTYTIVNSK